MTSPSKVKLPLITPLQPRPCLFPSSCRWVASPRESGEMAVLACTSRLMSCKGSARPALPKMRTSAAAAEYSLVCRLALASSTVPSRPFKGFAMGRLVRVMSAENPSARRRLPALSQSVTWAFVMASEQCRGRMSFRFVLPLPPPPFARSARAMGSSPTILGSTRPMVSGSNLPERRVRKFGAK